MALQPNPVGPMSFSLQEQLWVELVSKRPAKYLSQVTELSADSIGTGNYLPWPQDYPCPISGDSRTYQPYPVVYELFVAVHSFERRGSSIQTYSLPIELQLLLHLPLDLHGCRLASKKDQSSKNFQLEVLLGGLTGMPPPSHRKQS